MPEAGGRPRPLRVLAILNGPTPEAALGTDRKEQGALEELFDEHGHAVLLHVLRCPALADVPRTVQGWRPHIVYVYGGTAATSQDLESQAVAPLAFLFGTDGALLDAAVQLFQSAFAGLELEAAFLDFQGSAALAQDLHRTCGVRHVISWPADLAPPVLSAMDFAHAFFALLRDGSIAVPEAYTMAAHMARAHGTVVPPEGGDPVEPSIPSLLSPDDADPPPLPGNASVPPLELEGVDLSGGVAAAFPGYAGLRLLAPNAELRLLQAGISGMVNTHNFRYFGESLRALLAAEVRRLEVVSLAPCERAPQHMPLGSAAVRCEARSSSAARFVVTLGGPSDLLKNKDVVQHALRQALTADAHTLQLKMPPPGAPAPPTHVSPEVASGVPVVEGLAVTSVWCVQLLKMLAQEPSYRGLVALGVAAVSATPVAAWTAADAARFAAVVTHNDDSKAQPSLSPAALAAAAAAAAGATAAPMVVDTAPLLAPLPQQAQEAQQAQQAQQQPMAVMAAAPAVAAPEAPALQSLNGAASLPSDSLQLNNSGLARAGSGLTTATGATSGQQAGGPLSSAGPSGASGAAAAATAAAPQAPVGVGADVKPPPNLALLLQQQQLMHQQTLMQQQPWKTSRPNLSFCSEEQFYSDLIAFLTERQGRQIDPRTFPEAILNGGKLDLYHLYKEVCSRGGYKVGNGINWKGQVFPRMRNFTANHKMTGVGNALKRHYQHYLLEYEQAHPEDVTGDRCGICGRGDEHANDWVSCDMCDCWVHFSCDTRQSRGSFKDYSRGRGRVYHCPRCSEVRRHQSMQAQAQAQAAVAAQMAAAMQHLQARAASAALAASRQQAPPAGAAGQQQQTQHPPPTAAIQQLQQLLQAPVQPAAARQPSLQQPPQPPQAPEAAASVVADGPAPMQQ